MTDKLTNNEIIKALEFLAEYPNNYEEGQELKNALDLINRLKAENERLREEKSKIENKIDEIYPLVMQLPNAMQQAKAEAYKEFAERLKKKYKPYVILGSEVSEIEIDNLLKEIIGE